jgi:hypothetical protein
MCEYADVQMKLTNKVYGLLTMDYGQIKVNQLK